MTEHKHLPEALAAFQSELPRVSKASQGNRGRYADLADVSMTVLPLLAKHGLSWSAAPTVTDEGMFVLRYVLRHSAGGERIEGDYPLPSPSEPPQTLGSAITYAKRYALCAVTGVAPDNEDDDGAHATENHRAQPAPAQRRASTPTKAAPITQAAADVSRAKLRKACEDESWDMKLIAGMFEDEHLAALKGATLKETTNAALIDTFRESLTALRVVKARLDRDIADNGWDRDTIADLFAGQYGAELDDATSAQIVEKFRAGLYGLPSEQLKATAKASA